MFCACYCSLAESWSVSDQSAVFFLVFRHFRDKPAMISHHERDGRGVTAPALPTPKWSTHDLGDATTHPPLGVASGCRATNPIHCLGQLKYRVCVSCEDAIGSHCQQRMSRRTTQYLDEYTTSHILCSTYM